MSHIRTNTALRAMPLIWLAGGVDLVASGMSSPVYTSTPRCQTTTLRRRVDGIVAQN